VSRRESEAPHCGIIGDVHQDRERIEEICDPPLWRDAVLDSKLVRVPSPASRVHHVGPAMRWRLSFKGSNSSTLARRSRAVPASFSICMAFNSLISNTDDHPRNHAVIAPDNDWRLSPVYDLVPFRAVSFERRDLARRNADLGRYANARNLISQCARFLFTREKRRRESMQCRRMCANADMRSRGASELRRETVRGSLARMPMAGCDCSRGEQRLFQGVRSARSGTDDSVFHAPQRGGIGDIHRLIGNHGHGMGTPRLRGRDSRMGRPHERIELVDVPDDFPHACAYPAAPPPPIHSPSIRRTASSRRCFGGDMDGDQVTLGAGQRRGAVREEAFRHHGKIILVDNASSHSYFHLQAGRRLTTQRRAAARSASVVSCS
jgi:HipA-like C-terminal domain